MSATWERFESEDGLTVGDGWIDDELEEAGFEERLHPRGRGGKWEKKLDHYVHESGNAKIHDNGGGRGPAKDSGRWAVEVHGKPIKNVDTLADAKSMAEDHLAKQGDDEPIDVGDDVEKAAKLLSEGKRVSLNQPRQIATLLDRMAEMVKEARAAGNDAPNFDLCKVSVRGTNLFCVNSKGIPRVQMPQFKGMATPGSKADALAKNEKGRVNLGDAWREHLRGLGVEVTTGTERASYLRASQRDLNGANVARIAHEIEAGRETTPIFVSRDNYILDGHHQWAAVIGASSRDGNVDDTDMPIERIDMPITDLIAEAQKFTGDYGMAAQAATDRNEAVEPMDWQAPPPPVGKAGESKGGRGYSSDEAYGTNTALGHVGEAAFVKILGGGRVLHPEGKGAQSPLDVHFDGYGFEVKAVSTKTLGYKATPKKHEIASKEAAAQELGVKPALAIVVIDSDAGMAHAYFRDGLNGGRLSSNTGWNYLGSGKLDDAQSVERAHTDPRIREANSVEI